VPLREPRFDYHPFYGLPIVVVFAALGGALGWWSLLVLVPLAVLIVHLFFWPLRFRMIRER
jgi:hypothetical protein